MLEERRLLAVLFSSDFSETQALGIETGFQSSGPADEWHLSTGRGNPFGESANPSFYFGGDHGPFCLGLYDNDADGTLLSPPIDLTNVTSATLRFNHFLDVQDESDFATIGIVDSLGTTIIATSGTELPTDTNTWVPASFDLTPFVGESIQVAFRVTSDLSGRREGWYIDDIVVESGNLVGLETITAPVDVASPDANAFQTSEPVEAGSLATGPVDNMGSLGAGDDTGGGGQSIQERDDDLHWPASNVWTSNTPLHEFLDVEVRHDSERAQASISEKTRRRESSKPNGIEDGFVTFSGDTESSFDRGEWTQQGPIGANHRFLQNLSPANSVGGATHTVVAHPTDADILYVGTVNGGIWKTTNAS
ncbi:MAG: hypothetical protein AAGJ83_09615, partial [Planctomycetota bacterium]